MSPRSSNPILPRHTQHDQASSSKSKKKLGFHVHRSKKTGKRIVRPETERALAVKNDFVACCAEFIGTTSFLFFALGGTNVANGGAEASASSSDTAGGVGTTTGQIDTPKLLYISLSFGFSLLVNVWIFFRVSGGLFNPIVSFGLCLCKAITPFRCVVLTISQILGGISAAALIYGLTPGTLNVRTTLSPGMNTAQGLFLEMFLSALLMLTILLLAAEKHRSTHLAPVGIGLALFIAELTGVTYTGGSLNPARSFGPEVVGRVFAGYHWIYWLGPYLGAALAVALYKSLLYLDYETVNPDQDATFEGQAPIHVVVNEKSGNMELDQTKVEVATDPAKYVKEKAKRVIRSPSKESVELVENSDLSHLGEDVASCSSPTEPSIVLSR